MQIKDFVVHFIYLLRLKGFECLGLPAISLGFSGIRNALEEWAESSAPSDEHYRTFVSLRAGICSPGDIAQNLHELSSSLLQEYFTVPGGDVFWRITISPSFAREQLSKLDATLTNFLEFAVAGFLEARAKAEDNL